MELFARWCHSNVAWGPTKLTHKFYIEYCCVAWLINLIIILVHETYIPIWLGICFKDYVCIILLYHTIQPVTPNGSRNTYWHENWDNICKVHNVKSITAKIGWMKFSKWKNDIPSNNIKGAPQLRSRAAALALRARGMDLHDRLGVRLHPAMSVARLQWARGATEDGHRVQGAPMITDWLTGWPCNTLLHKSTSGSCIWKNNRNFVTTSTYHDIHNLSANSSPNQTLNSWNCHHRHGTFVIYCFLFWDPIRVPSPNWHHVLIKFQQQNSNRSSTNVLFLFPQCTGNLFHSRLTAAAGYAELGRGELNCEQCWLQGTPKHT